MPNRIDNCFKQLRGQKRKGFIPYICAGDPSLEKTVDLVHALENAGADLVELGIPFSDPLADGIVNQLAAQRALNAGATVRGVLGCIRNIRARSTIPIVLYTYLNPVLQFGFEKFHRKAEAAGVDGLLILDLPPEEDVAELGEAGQLLQRRAAPTQKQANRRNAQELDRLKRSSLKTENDSKNASETVFHVRLVAPTTPPARVAVITKNARGFLYYVSREGVTGARDSIATSLPQKIAELRKISDLPIAVGFGISNPDQAREVAQHADAVVVGSAIVDLIAKHGDKPEMVEKVGAFARELAKAIH
jgi:tryptophan synthase alpha chain